MRSLDPFFLQWKVDIEPLHSVESVGYKRPSRLRAYTLGRNTVPCHIITSLTAMQGAMVSVAILLRNPSTSEAADISHRQQRSADGEHRSSCAISSTSWHAA